RSTPNMMPRKPIYEDGGFSGGNTDRPALQRLLDDMRAGKVDVIVVYKELPRVDNCILCPRLSQYMTPRIARSRSMKPRLAGLGVMQLPRSSKMRPASKVDRLTRSLADFAKLVELFDKHNVSFVSVTLSAAKRMPDGACCEPKQCPASGWPYAGPTPRRVALRPRATPNGRAIVGSRHPDHPTGPLAADTPERETRGGGGGADAVAVRIRLANGFEAPRRRDRAGARSRWRAMLDPAVPDRSPRVAWHSSCAATRGAGSQPCSATVDDAIDPVPVDFLRAQIKAELLAHHPSEEAAHRMLLPMGDAHDGGNRCSLRPAYHGEHASLFRPWPAFARGASFGLSLARLMPRANGRLRCNGSPLARGDDFDCRCFDFGPVGSRANACRCRSAHRNILDPDRFEALLGDAKRHGSSFSIASQARSEPLARTSSSSPARMSLSTAFRTASPVTFVGRSTPRSLRREADDRMKSWVSVSLATGILHCVGAASLPPPPP